MKKKNNKSSFEQLSKVNSTNNFIALTITKDSAYYGEIIIQLFDTLCPKACNYFQNVIIANLPQGLPKNKKSVIEVSTIVPGYLIQAQRTYRKPQKEDLLFPEERGIISNHRYAVAVVPTYLPSSEFYITLKNSYWLDGKHIVIGYVSEGTSILKKISKNSVDNNDKPKRPICLHLPSLQGNKLDWEFERIIWIAYFTLGNPFNLLPEEIIKIILSYCRQPPGVQEQLKRTRKNFWQSFI